MTAAVVSRKVEGGSGREVPQPRGSLPSPPSQVPHEPLACQARHLLEGARLLEEVRRAGDDGELLRRGEERQSLPVEPEDRGVVAADDQERRRLHTSERLSGEVGAASTRDHRPTRSGRSAAAIKAAAAPVLEPK
jgi:hypothetical protein